MARPNKTSDRGQLPRNQPDDKTVRCAATEGAQQCLSATHGKYQNHRFGKAGETDQWNADGSPKIPDPTADTLVEELPSDEFAPDPALAAEARRLVAEEQARMAAEPQRGNTEQAREWLASQPPTGPLLGDVQDQARSQGLVKPKGADEVDRADMDRLGATHKHVQRPTTRPDASEALLSAGMGVLVPAAHQDFAITHAEESARVVVMLQTVGRMFRSIGDGQLTDATDLRTVYLKVRQIAATHGIDLDEQDGGS